MAGNGRIIFNTTSTGLGNTKLQFIPAAGGIGKSFEVITDREGNFNLDSAKADGTYTIKVMAGNTNEEMHSIENVRIDNSKAVLLDIPTDKLASKSLPGGIRKGYLDAINIDAGIQNLGNLQIYNAKAKKLSQETVASKVKELFGRNSNLRTQLISSIRKNSASAAMNVNRRFVEDDKSVIDANKSVIQDNSQEINSNVVQNSVLFLSDEQMAASGLTGDSEKALSAEQFDALALGSQNGRSIRTLTRTSTAEESSQDMDALLGDGGPGSGRTEAPPQLVPSGDASAYLDKSDVRPLLEDFIQEIKEDNQFDTAQARANLERLRDQVSDFQLDGGPAERESFYDFHHLMIAFESVWKEAIDQDVLQLSQDVYNKIVEMGLGDLINVSTDFLTALRDVANAYRAANCEEPPASVLAAFHVDPIVWSALDQEKRDALLNLAANFMQVRSSGFDLFGWFNGTVSEIQEQAARIIQFGQAKARERMNSLDVITDFLDKYKGKTTQPWAFTTYAAQGNERSINFGLLVTYRQFWQPKGYQVGKLVKTVTLAPKESRKYSKRQLTKSNLEQKTTDRNSRGSKDESSAIARAERSILDKAKNNSSLNGGGKIGFKDPTGEFAEASLGFATSAEEASENSKKDFHESVLKAALEFRNENGVEITTVNASENENTESGELMNPNDELPVTYLFYELQRRVNVREQIHRVTPVIYVAQEMPSPDQVTDEWIRSYDWILRKALLDPSFEPALNYLSTGRVADEKAISFLRESYESQRQIVETLKMNLVHVKEATNGRYTALEQAFEDQAKAISENDQESVFERAFEFVFGSSDRSPEDFKAVEDSSRDAYERAAQEERDLRGRLDREVSVLQNLTEKLSKAVATHEAYLDQISRLRGHIKQNILHYMQAIWSSETRDQRYFRLHKTQVPVLEGERTFTLVPASHLTVYDPRLRRGFSVKSRLKLNTNQLQFKNLEEMADIDHPLGFRGNYMILPLRQSNALTDFMMTPFFDQVCGLKDPHLAGSITVEEFADRVRAMKMKLPSADFEKIKPKLVEEFNRILTQTPVDGEEIVVPTDSMYIDALTGAHSILEDYKLLHRKIDVSKTRAELRGLELENVRLVSRLLLNETEDPQIDRKIVIGSDVRNNINIAPGDNP